MIREIAATEILAAVRSVGASDTNSVLRVAKAGSVSTNAGSVRTHWNRTETIPGCSPSAAPEDVNWSYHRIATTIQRLTYHGHDVEYSSAHRTGRVEHRAEKCGNSPKKMSKLPYTAMRP